MLDIKYVRERPDEIQEMLRQRHVEFPLEDLLNRDSACRKLITETQRMKEERNKVSKEISIEKAKGKVNAELVARMRNVSERIEKADMEITKYEIAIREYMLRLPNIPDPTVPKGEDAGSNLIIRTWGTPRYSATSSDHIDIAVRADLIDVDRAAKVAGARFYYLKRDLVRLNYALIQFGLDFMQEKGFIPIQPPYLLRRDAMEAAIILSDFEEVIYKIEGEDLYLIGTSEHALATMHKDEIFNPKELPRRYAGISPCFRKEAGAHGRDTKGIFRVHQFEKVEQFVFCEPKESSRELEMMLTNAQEFYEQLEIPYRTLILCTGDMGKVAAKTFDIEAYLPGQKAYREVVSCSNCTDYQARRLRTKFRRKPHEEAEYVHTLNSTLVATERCLIALMENHQTGDGGFDIPKVLSRYLGGITHISPALP